MIPRSIAAICVTWLVASAVLACGFDYWSANWATEATAQRDDRLATAHRLHATRQDLPGLQQSPPGPDQAPRIANELVRRLNLPPASLGGVQPVADSAMARGWHRQQVGIQVRGLTSTQCTELVKHAQHADPAWTVASIQLTHTGPGDRFDASMILTTFYTASP